MASKSASVMKILQGTDLKELNLSLKSYMAPLFENSASVKEKNALYEQRILAREYVPFLVQLLKVCGAKLASVPSREDCATVIMADELFSAMVLAMDGLNLLRDQLTGSLFEMELQRYALVRRLMNWKRFGAALSQSQLLFRSLCQLSSIPEPKASTVRQATSGRISKGGANKVKTWAGMPPPIDDSVLCPPRQVDLAPELPAVVVAAVIDLIWCIAESSEESSSCFRIAARLPEQLAPWIRVLDPGSATKQRDALFRAIYKCTLNMLADPTKFEGDLVHQFCTCTLSLCASSSQRDQYAKVARKLCSSLSYQGPDLCGIAVEICTAAFGKILSHDELQGVWSSCEFSDLVEWFARSCQTSNQVEHGWFQINKLVDHIRKVSAGAPVVMIGLYAVGLVLMQADSEIKIKGSGGDIQELPDLNKLEFYSQGMDFVHKACILLHGSAEVFKSLLQLGQPSAVGKIKDNKIVVFEGLATFDGNDKRQLPEITRGTFVSAARVLHFVQKPFTRFVQVIWNAYCARSSEKELPYSHFNSALGKVLQLFYPVIEKGMRCSDLNDHEKDNFKKGVQMASQASLASLRVSLLLQDSIQESFELVNDMTCQLQPEDQWWLMSSTYNMGAQLFNIKKYNLACWPLDLAYKAAWAKVKSSCSDIKSGLSVNEMVSESCAKCLALVDAQNRNGEPGKSRLTLIDGLMQWAKTQAETHSIKLPRSLVRSFVKLKCVEMTQPLTDSKANRDMWSLYSILCDIQPPIPAGIVGLLLEEELAVCETMEDQYPDTCHRLKEQIMQCLLDKLYSGGHFALHRSRILMKRCRDSKMHGAENLLSCISDISEAVSSLEAALEGMGKSTGNLCQVASLEKQLAVAYSIKGICSYEMDPGSQEFLPNIVLSLNLWRCVLDSHPMHGGLHEPEISLSTAIDEEEQLVLLLYISDLLAIQGYTVICSEAQEVILKVITHSEKASTKDKWVEFWMNGQVGHFLCAVPFCTDFLSTIRQSLDATANPQEYWQRCCNIFPGSLLEAHHQSAQIFRDLRLEATEGGRSTIEKLEGIQRIVKMIHARLSDGQKSSQFTLRTAGLYHLASELAFGNGDTHEAITYAKEAFQLRARLFKYVFSGLGKRASGLSSNATTNTSASGDLKILQLRQRLGPSATLSWPHSVEAHDCLSRPTQWRILGDYIESLMQMGVIYERMGAVDEAERSFREGHRLALAQNLRLALASFSMSLGEVHRKRQSWETAENYFTQAEQLIDSLQTRRSCESCICIGKALLQLQVGDLVRHCWYGQHGKKESGCHSNIVEHYPEKTLAGALSRYTAAASSISPHLEHSGEKCGSKKGVFVNSDETQIRMLRSLQKKGKNVSLEIMSHKLEETRTTGPETRRSRLRKSVQTKSSCLASSAAGSNGMERDITALCDDMRLTTLASDVGSSSMDQDGKSVYEQVCYTNGLRSAVQNIFVMAPVEDTVAAADILEDRSSTKQKYVAVQKELNVSTEGDVSSMTEAGRGSHPLQSRTSGCSFSIEEWPACKWTELARKLMSKVLLQKGKCYIHLEELDGAADMFQQAMSILNISCLDQPENTDIRESSFPVEEGALLYHVSRLWFKRRQHRGASSDSNYALAEIHRHEDSDDLEAGKVEIISKLYWAFSLCHQVPLLLHKISELLAILHVPFARGSPPLIPGGNFSVEQMTEVAAYFHQASLGTAIRQQHLAVLDSKLDAPLEDNQQFNQSLAKVCVDKMQQALRIAPVNAGSVVVQARNFWEHLPCSLACCISFVSKEDVNLLRGNCLSSVTDTDAVTDWLLMTRLSAESKPVVFLLPIVPILENLPHDGSRSKAGEGSSTPYDLSDDEDGDDDCKNPSNEQKQPPLNIVNQVHMNKQTVLRRVAAQFGSVLEESRLSTSGTRPVATLEEKSIWWKWRMELDVRLSVLLRMVEDSWLGPFKCLLLGEPEQPSMTKLFDFCTIHLLEMMSSIIYEGRSSSLDHSVVKVLLQAVGSLTALELEKVIAEMLGLHDYCLCDTHPNECEADCKNCRWKMGEAEKYEQIRKVANSFRAAYLVSTRLCETDTLKCLTDENSGKRRSRRPVKGKAGPKSKTILDIITQMASDNSHCPGAPLKRQPLQLILDSDAQALPWESLPILRDHEVYRMPSLGTIHAVHIQHQCHGSSDMIKNTEIQQAAPQKVDGRKVKAVKCSSVPAVMDFDKPLDITYVNPYNTYYILNPDGDLPSTQAAFEDWFTHQPGWQVITRHQPDFRICHLPDSCQLFVGKAGIVPTAEEYQIGLQNHDLFVYLGHGSGDQFLPERYVRQLDHCAASLLMGCSSGRLSLHGDYQPVGVVLSYLMAGCPAVIANLWDVTDGDIDRFSRFLLHSWLASSPESVNSDSEKGLRDINDYELAMRDGRNPDAAFQSRYTSKVNNRTLEKQAISQVAFQDMHRLCSAIGQSRNACRLPHLIGASPVCYGVPTGVSKQVLFYSRDLVVETLMHSQENPKKE